MTEPEPRKPRRYTSTRAEQETVIRWDEEDREIHLWTASHRTLRLLTRRGYKPLEINNGPDGRPRSWKFRLPDGAITLRSLHSVVRTPRQMPFSPPKSVGGTPEPSEGQ